MPDQREEVLNFISRNGPCLPVQISKIVNTNILFASAILSELVARKQLQLSHAAIGGSKLYYIKGQEAQLLERLSKAYKGKEKEAYDLIREHKVLRERTLEPWQRIALRIIKDAATSITVTIDNQAEVFWRYTLLNDADVETRISTLLTPELPPVPHVQTTITPPQIPTQTITETIQPPQAQPQTLAPTVQPTLRLEPSEHIPNAALQQAMANLREELIKEMKPQLPQQKEKKKTSERTRDIKSEKRFYTRIIDYLKTNNIEILKEEMVRKDKEFDFLVKIPSNIGPLLHYLKAKDKKTINEAELSLAYSEGQLKKLPTIFLVPGKPTKKAQAFLDQKLQGQLHIKELN